MYDVICANGCMKSCDAHGFDTQRQQGMLHSRPKYAVLLCSQMTRHYGITGHDSCEDKDRNNVVEDPWRPRHKNNNNAVMLK